MERFENAQVGDLVYCRLNGYGIVSYIATKETEETRYHLGVEFGSSKKYFYDFSGRYLKSYIEPTLFYRKGEERYLTERPEPEIDWATVAPGTVCFVKDFELESDVERLFLCFENGNKWFKTYTNMAKIWQYARIK